MTIRNSEVRIGLERRALARPIEFRAKAEGDKGLGVLEGYAALYNTDSADIGGFIERIAPGAFAESLASGAIDVFALADHDHTRRLGRVSAGSLRISDDDKGLRVEIDVPDTTTGRDMAEEVRLGLVKGMSFGFRTLSDTWEEHDDGSITRTLNKIELYEVSAVGNPAYPDTSIAKRALDVHRASDTTANRLSAEEERNKALQRLRLARA